MALKKSELYSSLWKSCDELRGGMDASQYKDYALVLLFMKYVSDKAASQKNYLLHVPKGGSFADMVLLKGDKEIGDKMNKIIAKLAEANDLKGVIDVADFNDEDKLGKGKEMVDRLSNLVSIFSNPSLDFSSNRAEGDDLLGDAYEYLMRHFATESGKSKGQFYTPAEVSRVMAQVVGVGLAKSASQTIHDPTCGSGSLLLKAHDEAKHRTGLDLALYGQEMDNATAALARMNMILHDCPTGEIWKDNVLASPHFKAQNGGLKTFDFIVANPPFSFKAWSNGFNPKEDEFGRFEFGIPPEKNGDLAFLLHILTCLRSTGKAAVNLPHGVLFRAGAEGGIRRELIQRGYIKGIIGLPANLFYGTGIPACIIVLDKENAQARRGIFMIDASKGFMKDGNKNRLRAQDIHRIVDTFTRQIEEPGYSRMVPLSEIRDAKNDSNLNLPRYVDTSETEDLQDIDAHLRGGIPVRDVDALAQYWKVCPQLRKTLFKDNRPGYLDLLVGKDEVKAAIFGHSEFVAFTTTMEAHFSKWQKRVATKLKALAPGFHPKELIQELSEDLLAHYADKPLIDQYDVYQHLMDYWANTMQDDCYLISADGWKAQPARVLVKNAKGKETDKGWTCELVPKELVVNRYFAAEQKAIQEQQAALESLSAQIAELEEEQGGEEGAFSELEKVNRASVAARLKKIQKDKEAAGERDVLTQWLKLSEEEGELKAVIRDAEEELDELALVKYAKLGEAEVKVLVVDDKWLTAIAADVHGEMVRISQALTQRLKDLAERYATPLPQAAKQVAVLEKAVIGHLERMGFSWK
jgi:type I restriction enzyme M protein